jgi:hypothetical protein
MVGWESERGSAGRPDVLGDGHGGRMTKPRLVVRGYACSVVAV